MTLVAACCLSLTDVRKPGNEGNKWLLQSGWSAACRFDVRYRSLETWRSVKTNMLSDFMGASGHGVRAGRGGRENRIGVT